MNDFSNRLSHFINKEAEAQIAQIKEMWALPLSERVTAGEAVEHIRIKAHDHRDDFDFAKAHFSRSAAFKPSQFILSCPENFSKFRPGDYLVLHQGDPEDKRTAFKCKVLEDNGNEFVVESGYKYDLNEADFSKRWILDRDVVDIRHLLQKVIEQAPATDLNFLSKPQKPVFNELRYKKADKLLRQLALNPSQEEAFAKAFATDNFYLIQGPPGTGKTWVLAHLAEALAKEGERVLVSALSHRAINNALRKIYEATYYPHIIKIGDSYNAQELSWDEGLVRNYKSLEACPYGSKSNGVIFGSTVYALHTRKLKSIYFDTIIFDEAGQVTLPLALAGIVKARRYIFIGDHQQMSPVVNAEYKEDSSIAQSVFKALHHADHSTMLTETYRMNEEINRFPSQYFYQNELQPAVSARSRKLKLTSISTVFPDILNPDLPSIFVDLAHQHKSIRCDEEATLAVNIINEAVKCGVPPSEIAVVVPYRAQARLIKNRLKSIPSSLSLYAMKNIVIDTVERIQGQERELVIISLTSSDVKHIADNASFFLNPNRLNVAITRAKTKRIVLGSRFLFDNNIDKKEYQAALEMFKDFYESCYKVKN